MESYLAILAFVIMILVYTAIKLVEANQKIKYLEYEHEQFRLMQIKMYGPDFDEWYGELGG